MRTMLMIPAASLFAVACSDTDMPSGEEMENDAEQAVEATGNALESAGDAVVDAAERAGEEMDEMGEDMPVREVNGRWGITSAACSMDNDMRDGVIVISRYTIAMGLDQCAIQTVDVGADGYTHFVTECEDGEGGGSYMRDFHVMRTGDTLSFDNLDMGRQEEYVRCTMDDER